MKERSNLEFKSNIYPLGSRAQIANDRAFLDSISDPFALDALWRYNASRGTKLNRLQRLQHGKAQRCMYAEPGDYPWGTRIVDGNMRVMCLCENWACPKIHECRPGVEIPKDPEPSSGGKGIDDEPATEDVVPAAPEEDLDEIFIEDTAPVSTPTEEPRVTSATHSAELEPDEGQLGEWTHPANCPKHYDEHQAVVVEAQPTRRLYVTAGPGTGKTHTLIEKLKYMIDVQEVDPATIVVMSFTRAAVQVVKDRLQSASLMNELESNWQAIDVTTFDKFCTRLLYWLKANEPKILGNRDIGRMDYDHRIYTAAKIVRENPALMGQCSHMIVDETQDLVGSRAKLVTTFVEHLPKECGITLLGDRCQSVYDYQASAATNSEAFYDKLREIGHFDEVTLEKNYRQNVRLPYSLDALRKSILNRDVTSASSEVSCILADLGVPERELRSLGLSTLDSKLDGTLGILTRTNAQAIAISSLFYKHSVPHTLLRAEREAFWSRMVADVLIRYKHETIDEESYIGIAERMGYSFEDAIRAWIGLTSLRGAKAEGMRYKVSNLLQAMTEEVVPESVVAAKSVQPGITISTIHGSKGREFDYVWLMADDLEKASSSKLLDEKKVAYVALSRARLGTSLQKDAGGGLKIDRVGNRCYRVSSARARRRARKRLTHIELLNSSDINFTSLLSKPSALQLAENGSLEGTEIRLCLPESVPESGPVAYDIETEGGLKLGVTTLSFISYYEQYYNKVAGEMRYLPEAFDELYVDRIISCVGKGSTAPKTARRFGDYAIWYGFTLGGFAHADNSQSH